MTNLDTKFFNEYKHLDKLLRDCYATENGVSSYIELMESKDEKGRLKVIGWQRDYKELKHLRYIRNKLAHETDEGLAEQKDVDSVLSYQVRITNADDPLALLEKSCKKEKRASQSKKHTPTKRTASPSQTKAKAKAPRKKAVKVKEDDSSRVPILLRVIVAQLAVVAITLAVSAIVLLLLNFI